MRHAVASLLALVLTLGPLGVVRPCVCEHEAAAERAEHACCAAARAAAEAGPRCTEACAPGCRHGKVERDALNAQAERDALTAPAAPLALAPAAPPAAPSPPGAALAVSGPERAPPGPLARRLASLQVWRC